MLQLHIIVIDDAFEHLHDFEVIHLLHEQLGVLDCQFMEKLVDRFRQSVLQGVEKGCDCCELKYKHLVLQLLPRLLSYNDVDYHVDCSHTQRLIIGVCP